MHDARIAWIQTRVYLGLDIKSHEIEWFEAFLERDNGDEGRRLLKFLNDPPTEHNDTLLFYKQIRQEEREVLVEYGKYYSFLFGFFFFCDERQASVKSCRW